MKYKILFVLLLLIVQGVYAQYLPERIKMGMNNKTIEDNLRVKLIHRKDNLYYYVDPTLAIIYQFNIEKVKGLIEYRVMGNIFNKGVIINNFKLCYGLPELIEDMYWWKNNENFQEDVISIVIYEREGILNLIYFFSNNLK